MRAETAPRPSPAPTDLNAGSDRLPASVTSFIGREQELGDLQALLQGEARLVTLLGPGGVGKTRLALEVGRQLAATFAGGVKLVELAPVGAADQVAQAIARTMGLIVDSGDAVERLQVSLQHEHLLLAVDNFEHVLEAAPLLVALLQACPRLSCLVTSRAALRVSGEREYAVQPLPAAAAIQLFHERAGAVRPPVTAAAGGSPDETVAAICARVDRLPLAIELAAARTRLFSPAQLLERLAGGTAHVLAGGARDLPARQRTLRDTVAWSDSLLTPIERLLLARLSVFRGSFTADAAEVICGGPAVPGVIGALEQLVTSSLVQAAPPSPSETPGTPDDAVRFSLLETVREYAHERLVEQGEVDSIYRRHAAYYADLCEAASRVLDDAPDQPTTIAETAARQRGWVARLRAETDNLVAALAWARRAAAAGQASHTGEVDHSGQASHRSQPDDLELALHVVSAVMRSVGAGAGPILPWGLGQTAADEVLDATPHHHMSRARELLLGKVVYARRMLGGANEQRRSRDLAREWWRMQQRIGADVRRGALDRQQAVLVLSSLELAAGEAAEARRLLEHAVAEARSVTPPEHSARWLASCAWMWVQLEDRSSHAVALLAEAEARAGSAPSPLTRAKLSLIGALVAFNAGDPEHAERCLEQALAASKAAGDPVYTALNVLSVLAGIAHARGRFAAARGYYEEMLTIFRTMGSAVRVARIQPWLALATLSEGDSGAARHHLSDALPVVLTHREPDALFASTIACIALLAHAGHVTLALRLLAQRDRAEPQGPGTRAIRRIADRTRQEVLAAAQQTLGTDEVARILRTGTDEPLVALLREARSALEQDSTATTGTTLTPSPDTPGARVSELTTREREVATLIAEGCTNRQIGERLVISERTVDNHVQRILAKLGLERRTQVASWITARAASSRSNVTHFTPDA